ncbi:hypothetical protein Bca52824_019302 [Brassica carinata]|uniref:Uncharacterized protein n=1 Tax=Brassica carinata TaxID=52824 RepID=A0A8X8AYE1_BRACI|nr:hypothetical protein Bca52824_019302 [Brassica carinata]
MQFLTFYTSTSGQSRRNAAEIAFSTSVYKRVLSAPDPIKLTFTSAYKRFLSSLDLDGLEMVETLKETNGSSRGAKAHVVEGIVLSEYNGQQDKKH